MHTRKIVTLLTFGFLFTATCLGCTNPESKTRAKKGSPKTVKQDKKADDSDTIKKANTPYGAALNKAKRVKKQVDKYNSRLEELAKPNQR